MIKRIIPFKLQSSSIKKLALLPFKKNPDSVYDTFELQYIDGNLYGSGYRILAWRKDTYIDIYDDINLQHAPNENFNIIGNRVHQHIQTTIKNLVFENKNGNEWISFEFTDIYGRNINFSIKEHINLSSKPLNLLSPLGIHLKNPDFLPAFFLYDFQFIRRKKTKRACFIDTKKITLDKFALPINGKFCYDVRFSENCTFIEFINTDYKIIEEVELNEQLSFIDDTVDYNFDKDGLNTIVLHIDTVKTPIKFTPSLALENSTGEFILQPREIMGNIKGTYHVTKNGSKITICIKPIYGWSPVPNSFISKLMFSKKSVFRNWSKKYELQQVLDLDTKEITGTWTNNNYT